MLHLFVFVMYLCFYDLDISKWSEKAVQKLGTIVNGLSTSEIESIPKTVFKKIDQFGRGLKINDDLKKTLAKRVKEVCMFCRIG